MKLFILLTLAAVASSAQLDRNYLPPSYAQSSGGNGQLLQTPNSFPQEYQSDDLTQATVSSFPSTDYNQNGFSNDGSFGQDNGAFNDFDQRPERPQAAVERSAAILRMDNRNDGETYAFAYETSNGIAAEESGEASEGVRAQGGYSYTGDDGKVYSVRYTADENGFLPQGDHLPTPPPIPEDILKALEKNAEDEANGIYDDGSYSEGKYDDQSGQQGGEAGYNYNNNNNGNRINAVGDYNAGIAGGAFNAENAGGAFNAGNPLGASADDEDSVYTNNALLRSNNAPQSRFGNQDGIEKAYRPPFQQNSQRSQAGLNSRYNPIQNNGFRNQANTGFGSQNPQRNYLPPQQFGNTQRSSGSRYNHNNGFRNEANIGFNGPNGIEKSYLPPQRNQQTSNGQNGLNRAYLSPGQFGQRNQPSNRGRNGVNRAYLPPGQFEQRSQNKASRRFLPRGNAANNQLSLQRSYLPPNQQQRYQSENANSFPKSNREYLPPSDNKNRFI